jgi:hypothetical protein
VATVEAILSLADLRQNDLISVDEAVALLKPTTVRVDDIVGILTRVAAQTGPESVTETTTPTEQKTVEIVLQQPLIMPVKEAPAIAAPTTAQDQPLYLLTPVADDEHGSAKDTIKRLLDQGWYVFRTTTPGRKGLKPGDRICFYETGVGVVAEAEVDSHPEEKKIPYVRDPEKFPWAFRVKNARYFFDQPVVIDAALRSHLDAFKGRDPEGPWAWLVQGTRKVTEHDFHVLTGRCKE